VHTLDRYITRTANRAVLAVLFAMLAVISLFTLFEELDESGVLYGFTEATWYIVQTMPRRFDELLTYCLFLGYLIALGRLAESNELTVSRVAGMSPTRIMLALAPSLLVWLIASVAISEAIAPTSERQAEIDKLDAKYGGDALNKRGGLWLRDGNLYMQVNAIDEDGQILSVLQYWVDDDRQLTETVLAESGAYSEATQSWTLSGVTRTVFESDATVTEKHDAWPWKNEISPELLASQAFLEPKKMSMLALYRQIEFVRDRNLSGTEYELAFWSRIFKPLTYVGFALFALGIVLGPLRQVGMGLRLTFGIFAGLAFKYLQDLFAPAAIVFNIPATIAILIPIAVYWGIALYLIRRNA
jgi:lipopolysaccharide export system permease protein